MPPRRPTPALMLQGCSSNAGKSVLAAAFCRMLLQDGFRVAPFKAQNMSLNSCVTADGAEMGRAQVTQAQACRLAPDARMNPVLLKPCSPTGSQVLLLGRPVGRMHVREYMAFKPKAFAAARQAYDELAAGHEVMVLEGAGSPAEINLKAHDIVNMAMARHAQARVLLAGDIDRGGVFAHFVGTLALLEPGERDLVEGLLVNRFRGDASLLTPAFEAMRRHAGKDVLGVIPWLADLGLPEEDSVTFKEAAGRDAGEGRPLRLVLVDLAHISNFTDFDALRLEPDVQLRVARTPADLAGADAILLPGTRSTAADLEQLRARGMAAAILELAARPSGDGPELVGVCGGLQMLGEDILDDDGVEADGPATRGLGLLPLRTSMGRDKILRQTAARHVPSGLEVRGYEIHHGRTEARGEGATPWMVRDGEVLGWGLGSGMAAGKIWGAYLHGLFDDDAFRRQWLNGLRRRKGLPPLDVMTRHDLEPALDRLADAVRAAVDWPRIRRSLGL